MSTGCTSGKQQCDNDHKDDYCNEENDDHPLLTKTTTLQRRHLQVQRQLQKRHATTTATTTLLYALLVSSSLFERGAEGFESYSGWSSSSRQVGDIFWELGKQLKQPNVILVPPRNNIYQAAWLQLSKKHAY